MSNMENTDETFIFTLRHFDQKIGQITILISHSLHFGALQILTDDCFVLRINKITYSTLKFGCFINFVFYTSFPTEYFLHSFVQGGVQIAYG